MRSKRLSLVGGFLILVITTVIILFNTSITSTQPPPPMTCFDDSDCLSGNICINGECTAEGDIILRLSSATNAHGETINGGGSYQFGISYSSIFGEAGSGDRTCDGNNKILGLSASTNAHAEEPAGTIYTTTEVCYEGLSCAERSGGCQAGESLVVSLSSSTNAHLSNSAGYGVDICCVIGEITPPLCGNDVINSGEVCDGTDLGGYSCTDFDEFPPGGALTCKSDCSGFITNQCIGYNCVPDDGVRTPGEEACDPSDPVDGLDGKTCLDFNEFFAEEGLGCDLNCDFDTSLCTEACSLTNAYWNTPDGGLEVMEGTAVGLIVEGDDCDGKTVSFEVWEDDPTDDLATIQPIDITFSGTTATGTWTAEWIDDGFLQGDPEYYFKATTTSDNIDSGKASAEELYVTEYFIDSDLCVNTVLCGDYGNQVDCNLDGCNVADFSVGNNINCGDPNKMCACSWIGASSTCNATWIGAADGGVIGECTYSQNTGDNCDDGFLTFSWTANWIWEGGKGAADDPENLFGECIDGSRTIECPAQIPLPFFGAYNFIVALIIIALIYVLWGSGSGKNRKKK